MGSIIHFYLRHLVVTSLGGMGNPVLAPLLVLSLTPIVYSVAVLLQMKIMVNWFLQVLIWFLLQHLS